MAAGPPLAHLIQLQSRLICLKNQRETLFSHSINGTDKNMELSCWVKMESKIFMMTLFHFTFPRNHLFMKDSIIHWKRRTDGRDIDICRQKAFGRWNIFARNLILVSVFTNFILYPKPNMRSSLKKIRRTEIVKLKRMERGKSATNFVKQMNYCIIMLIASAECKKINHCVKSNCSYLKCTSMLAQIIFWK